MTTRGEEQALAAARQARLEKIEGVPVFIGRLLSDGIHYGNASQPDQPNKLWVTRQDNRAELLVWNFIVNTTMSAGAAMRIKRNDRGEWTLAGPDEQKLDISHRAAASSILQPSISPQLDTGLKTGRNVMPGRLQVWVLGSLKMQASEGFWYYDTNNALRWWATSPIDPLTGNGVDDGRCLDLAANVPAAVGGVSQERLIVVTFNNDALTPGFTATEGPAQYVTLPDPTRASIADIALPDEKPLAAVLLQTGDVDERNLIESDFIEMRFWTWGSSTGSSTGGTGLILLDADGLPVIDADGFYIEGA